MARWTPANCQIRQLTTLQLGGDVVQGQLETLGKL